MKLNRSRLTIFVARWAILSGLAGVVFATLVLMRSDTVIDGTQRNLLLVSAVLLSLAFILAPLVRRAFVPPTTVVAPRDQTRRTLLDEMREGEGESAIQADATPQPSRVAFRLLIGLYLVFGILLIVVLNKL